MPAKKKATRKKPASKAKARKSPAKKSAAKKRPAKKTTRKAAKKSTARKAKPRKAAAKRKPAKKSTARKATSSIQVLKAAPAVKNAFTKTELNRTLAEMTGLGNKDVKMVLEALEKVIHAHVASRGPQTFTLPGLAKIKVVRKKATKARKGINPFTGEPTTFKAKPARNVVKVQALKKLKEMAK